MKCTLMQNEWLVMFEELHKYSKNKVKYIQLMHFTQNQNKLEARCNQAAIDFWTLIINQLHMCTFILKDPNEAFRHGCI